MISATGSSVFNAGLCTRSLHICVRLAACAGLAALLIHLDVMQTFVVFNEIYFNGISSCCLVQLLQSYMFFRGFKCMFY